MNKYKDKLVLVETRSGDSLIGFIVPNPGDKVIPGSSKRNGIWLARKTHLTFLSHLEVKSISLANSFDEEVDNSARLFR